MISSEHRKKNEILFFIFSANKMKRRFSQPNERMAREKRKELNFISIIKKRNIICYWINCSVLPSSKWIKFVFFLLFRFFSFAITNDDNDDDGSQIIKHKQTNKHFIHLVLRIKKHYLLNTKHARKLNLIFEFSKFFRCINLLDFFFLRWLIELLGCNQIFFIKLN